jgi:LmbE family N-acetylglucosaminyl deacetylase
VAPEAVHAPDAKLSPEQAANSYEELFNMRQLDVAIVAIGPNGNIGWLAKGTGESGKGAHVVELEGSFGQGYSSCVTLGLKQLKQAKEVFLMAVNRNKAEVVEKALADKEGATAAGWLLHHHKRIFLCLDAPAAQRLIAQHQAPALNVPGFTFLTEESLTQIVGKTVICFSPHPDDTAISAGATLAMLSANNSVTSCVCTTGHRAYIPNTTAEQRIAMREAESTEEARILGARVKFLRLPLYNRSSVVDDEDVRIMLAYLDEAQPHMIFMPQTGDTHQTHRAVAKTILQALQRYQSTHADLPPVELYMYEGPWSLYSKGSYNVIASPSAPYFAKKMAAIQVHKSQTARTAYDRAADSLALLRGALVPEQDLGGFGDQPPSLPERLELFYKRVALTPEDLHQLLIWLDSSAPPKPKRP